MIGSNSRFTCFSFQAIKQMTTVDGGAISFRNEDDLNFVRKMRWFGLDKKVSRLQNDITRAGYKYGMNNVNATIGSVQLRHEPGIISTCVSNGQFYDNALKDVPGVKVVPYYPCTEPSYWLYTMKVENRDGFIKMMESKGISASPLHHRSDTHSVFSESRCELPGLDEWYSSFIHIPCGWWVNDEIRERIADTIKKGW
jgi:dTDP-4-amino-4,6-dideoxygalactose transaminase